jgi:ornithine carbamoyltransferase
MSAAKQENVRHLLKISDLKKSEIQRIIDLALDIKANPDKYS